MKLMKNKYINEKKFRIAIFGLYQLWAFVFLVLFFFTVQLFSSICFFVNTPWNLQKILSFSSIFREYWNKKWKKHWVNTIMKGLPWSTYTAQRWFLDPIQHSCAHVPFRDTHSPTYNVYLSFFNQPLTPLHHDLMFLNTFFWKVTKH